MTFNDAVELIIQSRKRLYQLLAGTNTVSFLLGLLIGWMLLGWVLWPVQYNPGGYDTLSEPYRVQVVYIASEVYSYDLDKIKARGLLGHWGGGDLACKLARTEQNLESRARLLSIAYVVNNYGCNQQSDPPR